MSTGRSIIQLPLVFALVLSVVLAFYNLVQSSHMTEGIAALWQYHLKSFLVILLLNGIPYALLSILLFITYKRDSDLRPLKTLAISGLIGGALPTLLILIFVSSHALFEGTGLSVLFIGVPSASLFGVMIGYVIGVFLCFRYE